METSLMRFNQMEKKAIKKIIIIDHFGETKQLSDSDILNIQTSSSVDHYSGSFNVMLTNEAGKNSKIAEATNEIEIWAGYAETGMKKIMAGYIDNIVFQKKEESGETVELQGRSYESFLFDKKVSGKIQFTNGFSQVVREILKTSPFDLKEIQDSKGTGVVIFRNIPIIDLIRQLSEEVGWVFRIDYDKKFYFKPDLRSTTHHHTLTAKDLKGYKVTKR